MLRFDIKNIDFKQKKEISFLFNQQFSIEQSHQLTLNTIRASFYYLLKQCLITDTQKWKK